jgi:hypothetical protein
MTLTSTNFTTPKTGVVIGTSGGGVKVSPSSGMTVAISSGSYFLGGKQVAYAGGTKTISTAHPTLSRYDVIGIDSNGTIIVKEGTPAASPSVPISRDDLLLLAVITVTANDSTIAAGDITDVRNIGGVSVDGTTLSISSGGVMSVLAAGITGFPAVIASGSGATTIVGTGANQTVFTDTFTAPADGDLLVLTVRLKVSGGVDNPDAIFTVGGTTADTLTMVPGASPNYVLWRGTCVFSATATRGHLQVFRKAQVATEINVIDQDGNTSAPTSITVTVDPAVGSTETCQYSYTVVKYATGV